MRRIYLDHNATSPLHRAAREARIVTSTVEHQVAGLLPELVERLRQGVDGHG